jgi:hypothetical protein
MADIIFGKPPSGKKKASVLSAMTSGGEYDPVEPSKVAVYCNAAFTPLSALRRVLLYPYSRSFLDS